MKKLIASLCAGAAILAPSASMAQVTNNLLQAEGTLTYECSVDPVSITMDNTEVSGRLLGRGNGYGFRQSGDTTWELRQGEVGGDINGQQLIGSFEIRWDGVTNNSGPQPEILENYGVVDGITPSRTSTFISGSREGRFDVLAIVRTAELEEALQPGTYQLNQILSCYSQNQFGFSSENP